MSALRALMSRQNGTVRSRALFEETGESATRNEASAMLDPTPIGATTHLLLVERVRAIKRQRLLSPDALRDFEEFEKVCISLFFTHA